MIETDKVSFYCLRTNAANCVTFDYGEANWCRNIALSTFIGSIFYLMDSMGRKCELNDWDHAWDW
jgi:hypothetical protein